MKKEIQKLQQMLETVKDKEQVEAIRKKIALLKSGKSVTK